jgi:hypothetical protein
MTNNLVVGNAQKQASLFEMPPKKPQVKEEEKKEADTKNAYRVNNLL